MYCSRGISYHIPTYMTSLHTLSLAFPKNPTSSHSNPQHHGHPPCLNTATSESTPPLAWAHGQTPAVGGGNMTPRLAICKSIHTSGCHIHIYSQQVVQDGPRPRTEDPTGRAGYLFPPPGRDGYVTTSVYLQHTGVCMYSPATLHTLHTGEYRRRSRPASCQNLFVAKTDA